MVFIQSIQQVVGIKDFAFAKNIFEKTFEPTSTMMNDIQLELLQALGLIYP